MIAFMGSDVLHRLPKRADRSLISEAITREDHARVTKIRIYSRLLCLLCNNTAAGQEREWGWVQSRETKEGRRKSVSLDVCALIGLLCRCVFRTNESPVLFLNGGDDG